MIRLRVPAQRMLSSVARYCCEQGWAGLDWAVGLPGTIGGAVANNAGAHGTEMIDNLEALAVIGIKPRPKIVYCAHGWMIDPDKPVAGRSVMQ